MRPGSAGSHYLPAMVFLLVPRISTQGDFLLVIGYWFFIGFIGGADPGAVEHVPPERPHVPEAVEEAQSIALAGQSPCWQLPGRHTKVPPALHLK